MALSVKSKMYNHKTRKMKKNRLLALTMAVLFNCITGSVFGAVLGFSPVEGALGMNCIASMVGGKVA